MENELKYYLDVTGLIKLTEYYKDIFIRKKDIQNVILQGSDKPVSSNAIYIELEKIKSQIGARMEFNTKSYWDSQTDLVSKMNCVYFYTDAKIVNGYNIARLKIGDGKSLLADLPFIDTLYEDHINNTDIHVTLQEKTFWNGKAKAYVDDTDEQLVLTIN